MESYDVVISGCGISGVAAAFTLSESNLSYLVLEKRPPEGRKEREWQILENVFSKENILENIENDIGIKIIGKPAKEFEIFAGSDKYKLSFDDEIGYFVQRGGKDCLENRIRKKVRNINLLNSTHIKSMKKENKQTILTLSNGQTVGCKHLFIAEGNASCLTRKYKKDFSMGIVLLFEVREKGGKQKNSFFLSNELAPQGYVYVFFGKEFTTIGLAYPSNKINRKHFSKFTKLPQIESILKKSAILNRFSDFQIISSEYLFSKDDIIFLGNSAGILDPAFGAGIKYALYSGFFAADSVIKNDIGLYGKNFMSKFGKELDTLANVRKIYNLLDDNSYSKILHMLQKLEMKSRRDWSRLFVLAKNSNWLMKILGIIK